MFGSGTATLLFSNEDLNDTMRIVKSLEEYDLLIKGIIETENKAKEQKGRFLRMLLRTLGAGLGALSINR